MTTSVTPPRLVVKCFTMLTMLCALPLVTQFAAPLIAQHAVPSTTFLETNDLFLRSAGFSVKFANDAAGRRALKALPPHRFVIHTKDGRQLYVYADPGRCNCVFTGAINNFRSYQDLLRNPLAGVDDVAPDYKTQASALLADPTPIGDVGDPDTVAEFLRDTF